MLRCVVAALPPQTPAERAVLVPKLLRAWVAEDLKQHLMREGRTATKRRQERLTKIGGQARNLVEKIRGLD
ncbi:MAG: hypothetical protein ACREFB_01875, partial [Stellaceae bacterium]